MKIALVSTAALPAPAPGYAGLENVVWWLAEGMSRKGHDVVLLTTSDSPKLGEWKTTPGTVQADTGGRLRVVGTNPSRWDGNGERDNFFAYMKLLEAEFGNGEGVIFDHTWAAYAYMLVSGQPGVCGPHPNMKLLHMHHGMLGFNQSPNVPHPRFLAASNQSAQLYSQIMKPGIAVRAIHHGIPPVSDQESEMAMKTDGNYLLSLNRMTQEKGIHIAIDCAIRARMKIKVVGDDQHVADQAYVHRIYEQCRNSGGLAEYYGSVDNLTKTNLIQNCSAVVAFTQSDWMEVFGLYVLEALQMGKPVIASKRSLLFLDQGYTEIIRPGVDGFLPSTPDEMVHAISQLQSIDREKCRERVKMWFTQDHMVDRYLEVAQGILAGDARYNW